MSKIELKEVERKEKGRIKQTVNKESRTKSHFVCFDACDPLKHRPAQCHAEAENPGGHTDGVFQL